MLLTPTGFLSMEATIYCRGANDTWRVLLNKFLDNMLPYHFRAKRIHVKHLARLVDSHLRATELMHMPVTYKRRGDIFCERCVRLDRAQ